MKSFLLLSCISGAAFASDAFAERNFYLRCNNTSWQADSITQMKAVSIGAQITVDNKGQLNDDCVLTETNAAQSWGSEQKNFGLDRPELRLNENANIFTVDKSLEPQSHFKVNYPEAGRYTFTLDVNSLRLNLSKESTALNVPLRDAAFEVKGRVVTDTQGRLFADTVGNGSSLSRIDPANGQTLWTVRADQGYVVSNTQCIQNDVMFLTVGTKVKAVRVQDGQGVWESDLSGSLDMNQSFLSCFELGHNLLIHTSDSGQPNTRLTALNKYNGQTSWTYTSDSYASAMAGDWNHFVINSYGNGVTKFTVLDQSLGTVRWSREVSNGWIDLDSKGRFFEQSQSQISHLDPWSGSTLWTYKGDSLSGLVRTEGDEVLVQSASGLTRLEAGTGRSLWSHSFDGPLNTSYTSIQVLRDGLLLTTARTDSQGTDAKLVDKNSGLELWSRSDSGNASYVIDNQGELYVQVYSKLSLLGKHGQAIWTLDAPKPDYADVFFSRVERQGNTLFVQYSSLIGHKYPPMGLLSLNAESGKVNWLYKSTSPLNLVSADSANYVYVMSFFGSSFLAISK